MELHNIADEFGSVGDPFGFSLQPQQDRHQKQHHQPIRPRINELMSSERDRYRQTNTNTPTATKTSGAHKNGKSQQTNHQNRQQQPSSELINLAHNHAGSSSPQDTISLLTTSPSAFAAAGSGDCPPNMGKGVNDQVDAIHRYRSNFFSAADGEQVGPKIHRGLPLRLLPSQHHHQQKYLSSQLSPSQTSIYSINTKSNDGDRLRDSSKVVRDGEPQEDGEPSLFSSASDGSAGASPVRHAPSTAYSVATSHDAGGTTSSLTGPHETNNADSTVSNKSDNFDNKRTLRKSTNTAVAKASKAYREQMEQLVSSLQDNLSSCQRRIQQQEQSIKEKEVQFNQLESDYCHLQHSYQKTREQLEEQSLIAVRQKRDAQDKSTEVDRLRRQLLQLKELREQQNLQANSIGGASTILNLMPSSSDVESNAHLDALKAQWLQVQRVQMDEIEAQQAQQEQEWMDQYSALETQQNQWKQDKARQQRELEQQEMEWKSRHGHLTEWENRLLKEQDAIETKKLGLSQQVAATTKRIKELQHMIALLKQENNMLEQQQQALQAQHALGEQTISDIIKRRKEEEAKVDLILKNLDEMTIQSKKVRDDSKIVKDALKSKITNCHVEYQELASHLSKSKKELHTIQNRISKYRQEEQGYCVEIESRVQQEVQDIKLLRETMDRLRTDMLLDEEALVEQSQERDELQQQINLRRQKLAKLQHECKQQQQEQFNEHCKEWNATLQIQTSKAKDELVSLNQFVMNQLESIMVEHETRVMQLDSTENKLSKAIESYHSEKEQLNHDIVEYSKKNSKIELMMKQLDYSEQQYLANQQSLENEIQELQSTLRNERQQYHNDKQKLQQRIASHEMEAKEAKQKYHQIQNNYEKLQVTLDEYMFKDSEEKVQLQNMIGQLEQNSHTLKQKQQSISHHDKLLRKARSSLEFRFNELLRKEQDLSREQEELEQYLSERRQYMEHEALQHIKNIGREVYQRTSSYKNLFDEQRELLQQDAEYHLRRFLSSLDEEKIALERQQVTTQRETSNQCEVLVQAKENIETEMSTLANQRLESLIFELSNQRASLEEGLTEQRNLLQHQLSNEVMELQQSSDMFLRRHQEALAWKMEHLKQTLAKDRTMLHDQMERELHEKRFELVKDLTAGRLELEKEVSESESNIEELHENLTLEWTRFRRDIQRAALARLMSKPWRQDLEASSAAFSKWVSATMFEHAPSNKVKLGNVDCQEVRAAKHEVELALKQLEGRRSELTTKEQVLQIRANKISKNEERLRVSKRELENQAEALALQSKTIEQQTRTIEERSKASLRDMTERTNVMEEQNRLAKEHLEIRSKALEQQAYLLEQQLHQLEKQASESRQYIKDRTEILERRESEIEEMEKSVGMRLACLEEHNRKLKEHDPEELELIEQRIQDEREQLDHERKSLNQTRESLKKLEGDLQLKKDELDKKESKLLEQQQKIDEMIVVATSQPAYGPATNNVVSQALLDETLQMERKWMEETAACVFERETELHQKAVDLKNSEDAIRQREHEIEIESKEILDTRIRMQDLAEQIKKKESAVREGERRLEAEIKKCKDAQSRVQQMALRLKQKDAELTAERRELELRSSECDILEQQLQKWQLELEQGASAVGSGGCNGRSDGNDMGGSRVASE